jgi:hypothetical protein
MIDITNERPSPIENIAESSFTEPAASIEHCIRLVEDIELLTDANGKIVSKREAVVWFMQGQRQQFVRRGTILYEHMHTCTEIKHPVWMHAFFISAIEYDHRRLKRRMNDQV